MAINKVVYGGNTLIDLTADTVTADNLMQGYTAHDNSGAIITGTATGGGGTDGDNLGYGYAPIAGTAVVGSTVLPNIGKVGNAKVGITLV